MRQVEPTWKSCVLVCTHERDPETGRASCGLRAGTELRTYLKDRVKAEGLRKDVLAAKSSCLDICSPQGVTVAVVPEQGERQLILFPHGADPAALWDRVRAVLLG